MNRIDRLLAIAITLQSRKYTTAEVLSERFGMSVRTVYRDLKALDEIGIPIGFESNKGYYVMQGYFLPPVMFSTEEANALVLVESIVERFTDKSIRRHYHSALNKVKAVLKHQQKEHVEHLEDKVVTSASCPNHNFEYLAEIQTSITNQTILQLHYQNAGQEGSLREIEPIGMIFYSMAWHVIGWCWLRNEYRDFKVARILKLQNTYKPFRKADHQHLNDYIKQQEMRMVLT
ncbi:helix-turn-helix transcriptional regulator [Runella aurantiaca]|uniref:YafY family transcriptional regulator n=1 Tax=Runella aurantiaca TaxID=2282308 RepID=A0A369I3I5_9BACT|nr:YafY family protein [Runella aurantiaca]RDB03612.1 YafY family transcriptional regulator [Runella aurantiaca]